MSDALRTRSQEMAIWFSSSTGQGVGCGRETPVEKTALPGVCNPGGLLHAAVVLAAVIRLLLNVNTVEH